MESLDGLAIANQLEGTEQTQKPEGPNGAKIDSGSYVEREYGQQVNEAEEAEHVAQPAISDCNTQNIFRGEDCDCPDLDGTQDLPGGRGEVWQSIYGEGYERDDDERLYHDIEQATSSRIGSLDESLQVHAVPVSCRCRPTAEPINWRTRSGLAASSDGRQRR